MPITLGAGLGAGVSITTAGLPLGAVGASMVVGELLTTIGVGSQVGFYKSEAVRRIKECNAQTLLAYDSPHLLA